MQHRELSSVLYDDLKGWGCGREVEREGGVRGRGYMYIR